VNDLGCEADLLAELPSLLSRLHAGEATAIQISHRVDADGICQLTVELVRPEHPPDSDTDGGGGQPWEYRWP
jgi:hypothetical protein